MQVFKDMGAMDVHDKLVGIVENPDWKTMLTDIVKAEGMDPWNIDVSVLAGKYLEKINSMRKIDFRIPANAVLCSSILIRFKSDAWELYPAEQLEDKLEDDCWEYIIDGERVPDLEPARRITRRRITIDDLIDAVEKVMDKERRRAIKKQRLEIPTELVNIAFEEQEEFEKMLDIVYKRVLANADSNKMTMFSRIVTGKTKTDTIMTLIPLLHLATHGKIGIFQEKIFDEIFIVLANGNGNGKKALGGSGAVHERGASNN